MTHTPRHGGCGPSRAAGEIPRRSTARAARCVASAADARPTPCARRGRRRVPSCASAAPPRTPGNSSALPTSVQGCASSERRIPPRALGARPRALDRPSPGAASRAEVTSPGGVESALPAPWSPARERPSPHSGSAHTVQSKDWTEVEQAGVDGAQSASRVPASSTSENPSSSPKVVSMRRRKAS